MTTFTLAPQYLKILQAFGNVEDMLEEAIRFYATERIGEHIGKLQHEILRFQTQYGLPYEKFSAQITTDEDFVKGLREQHPTWERDLNTWEYYHEELHEWLGRLESISKKS